MFHFGPNFWQQIHCHNSGKIHLPLGCNMHLSTIRFRSGDATEKKNCREFESTEINSTSFMHSALHYLQDHVEDNHTLTFVPRHLAFWWCTIEDWYHRWVFSTGLTRFAPWPPALIHPETFSVAYPISSWMQRSLIYLMTLTVLRIAL